jgi:hypothetical protein
MRYQLFQWNYEQTNQIIIVWNLNYYIYYKLNKLGTSAGGICIVCIHHT